jgi:hypothetical protein
MAVVRRVLAVLLVVGAFLVPAQPALAQRGGHTIFGQDYTLASGERLAGDLVVLGGTTHLEPGSVVDGNITVMGGETVIEGLVHGDVVAMGGSLELGARADVGGDLVAFGNVRRHSGATVRGDLVTGAGVARHLEGLPRMLPERVAPAPQVPQSAGLSESLSWLTSLLRQVLGLATVLAAAALLTILFSTQLARVTHTMSSAWLQSAGVGALTAVVALILAPMLAITCIGLPVSFVVIVALGLAVLLGWTGAGHIVGESVARAANLRLTASVGKVLLGVGLISLIAMLPCLGFLITLTLAAWGLGATVLTRFGTRPYEPVVPPRSEDGAPGEAPTPRGGTRPLNALPDDE